MEPAASGVLTVDTRVLDSGVQRVPAELRRAAGRIRRRAEVSAARRCIAFLLRYHARTGNAEALDMVLLTLREMAKGGMHDHLGGGFHRYSVDERWFVPHFEKMLYDQAQLAVAYLEAFQITGDRAYADVARSIFDYVLRDMTAPEGGFYSAEDADSVIDAGGAGREGRRRVLHLERGGDSRAGAGTGRRRGSATATAWRMAGTWRTTRTANSRARTFCTSP